MTIHTIITGNDLELSDLPAQYGAFVPQTDLGRWSCDPLEADEPSDEIVMVTPRRLLRLAIAAADAGARFSREGLNLDPVAWMIAPRQLFDGRSAMDACQDLDHFHRSVVLHGLNIGLDASPSDIDELLELDADDIRDRVFASGDDLPEGVERLPLKGVHLNKSPMLSPIATLRGPDAERWGIDLAACHANHAKLLAAGDALRDKVREVFTQEPRDWADPELSLYGGFLPDADKARLATVRNAGPDSIARLHGSFADPRYDELLFRYRARHYPDTLDEDERARWQDFVAGKLRYDNGLSTMTLDAYREHVAALATRERDPDKLRVLAQLAAWPSESGLERLLRG